MTKQFYTAQDLHELLSVSERVGEQGLRAYPHHERGAPGAGVSDRERPCSRGLRQEEVLRGGSR